MMDGWRIDISIYKSGKEDATFQHIPRKIKLHKHNHMATDLKSIKSQKKQKEQKVCTFNNFLDH